MQFTSCYKRWLRKRWGGTTLTRNPVAMLRSCNFQQPLAEKAAGWIWKFSPREEFWTRTSQQPLTVSHRFWRSFEQTVTNAPPTLSRDVRNLSGLRWLNPLFQPLRTSDIEELAANASYVCERLSIDSYWHPSWIRPLLRNWLCYVSLGW